MSSTTNKKMQQISKRFFISFLQAFAVPALFLGVFDILFPNTFDLGNSGLEVIIGIALLYAAFTIRPRLEISRQLSSPDTKIIIKVGDLFNQQENLVIGMNDVFDTEKGNIIKPKSIQGQFLTKIYNDDRTRLDRELSSALRGISASRDSQKNQGKNMRYPIGTVATLEEGAKKYFCPAYSVMGNDLKAQSDIKKLSTTLDMLWEEIRVRGQREKIAMAVLGSDLARIGNASHSNLIKLIVSSFILSSREKPITEELIIVVHPNNLEKINMLELNDFLQNF